MVVAFCGNNAINVLAVEPSAYTEELDLLFGENTDLQEMSDAISKIDYDIEIEFYPEAGLMHLNIPDTVNVDDIISNKLIKKNLEVQGNLGIIETGKMDLSAIYAQNLDTYGYEMEVSQNISNEMIFDLMAWHVDEVTNNRKSLELSKGNGVKIAVIDSGVDPYHPFLINNINFKDARSFIGGDDSIIDTNGHGTMITGIIRQIAPESIITPYRVIGNSTGDTIWTISAIIAAADDGNDIINMSLGAYVCKNDNSVKLTVKAFERAIKYAEKKDTIMVAASGNSGLDMKQIYKTEHIVYLPSSIKGVNGVSSVNNNQLTEYSNYGSNIQFCSPGGDYVFTDGYLNLGCMIYGLYPTYFDNGLAILGIPQGYTFSIGTSLATPSVTAGLADVLSYYRLNNYKGKKIKNKDIIDALADGVRINAPIYYHIICFL